jgi:hypothetical protein
LNSRIDPCCFPTTVSFRIADCDNVLPAAASSSASESASMRRLRYALLWCSTPLTAQLRLVVFAAMLLTAASTIYTIATLHSIPTPPT